MTSQSNGATYHRAGTVRKPKIFRRDQEKIVASRRRRAYVLFPAMNPPSNKELLP
jgi:hypothetical protein